MDNILGLVENIKINGKNVLAKIDTGASTSSIDTKLAEELNLGPTIKTKSVKSASGESIRPIIRAKISIKDKEMVTRFNLIDREDMKYKVLIGKNTLKRMGFVINPKK